MTRLATDGCALLEASTYAQVRGLVAAVLTGETEIALRLAEYLDKRLPAAQLTLADVGAGAKLSVNNLHFS